MFGAREPGDPLLELFIVSLFLAVMLAPWVYAAQAAARVRIPVWTVLMAALVLGTFLQRAFGANATYYIGYYGALIFGLGIVAAAFAYISGRGK